MKDDHKGPDLWDESRNKSDLGSGIQFITGFQSPWQQNYVQALCVSEELTLGWELQMLSPAWARASAGQSSTGLKPSRATVMLPAVDSCLPRAHSYQLSL